MANAQLFKSLVGKMLPKANTVNNEGAIAYAFTPKHALAQYAMTGCLNHTFYSSAEMQLTTVLQLAAETDDRFLAQLAVYSRKQGAMKDMPALLLAILAQRQSALLTPAFNQVIDNGKMLRNFVQIIRSGVTGRKSLGSRPKKLVQEWLLNASEDRLLNASIGNEPSLADVVKMVHPTPKEASQAAFFAWLIGKPFDIKALPNNLQSYELYKRSQTGEHATDVVAASNDVPNVPFQMLTNLPLTTAQWSQIARTMSWQTLRMNLNTLQRHGVFADKAMVDFVAARLRDSASVRKAKVFPYQLLMAYNATGTETPNAIRSALHDALEHSLVNVPELKGLQVVVCPDVSGSMRSPATGFRKGATSTVRCIDVAALVSAALLRRNPHTRVLPFECSVVNVRLNDRDTVLTNAEKLAAVGGGGTNCSAPLALLNKEKAKVDLVVFVSDNESWVDNRAHGATEMMRQWQEIRQRNPQAKLVCIDIQPNRTSQVADREDILNIGGFSDEVFKLVGLFAQDQLQANHWVEVIEKVDLGM